MPVLDGGVRCCEAGRPQGQTGLSMPFFMPVLKKNLLLLSGAPCNQPRHWTFGSQITYMRFVSLTAMFLGNVIVGIFLSPSLSCRQQRVHRASCVGFYVTEGGRALGTRQVLTLERQSCPNYQSQNSESHQTSRRLILSKRVCNKAPRPVRSYPDLRQTRRFHRGFLIRPLCYGSDEPFPVTK